MAEKLSGDYKTCPLKRGTADDFLVFHNLDYNPEDLATIRRSGSAKLKTDDRIERIETIVGRCDGPRCAWWDEKNEKCGVLSALERL